MARIIDLMPGESHTFPDGTMVRAVLPEVPKHSLRIEREPDAATQAEGRAIRRIRSALGMTQTELGDGIGCTQGNIGHYERGQTLPPEMARKVIEFCASKGLCITFDHVYGDAALPAAEQQEPAKAES